MHECIRAFYCLLCVYNKCILKSRCKLVENPITQDLQTKVNISSTQFMGLTPFNIQGSCESLCNYIGSLITWIHWLTMVALAWYLMSWIEIGVKNHKNHHLRRISRFIFIWEKSFWEMRRKYSFPIGLTSFISALSFHSLYCN